MDRSSRSLPISHQYGQGDVYDEGDRDVINDNDSATLESVFLDNIIVGYAFGPKKMDTMGLIMAEASKALSTVECSWMMQRERCRNFAAGLDESSMATATTCAGASLVTNQQAAADGGEDNVAEKSSSSATMLLPPRTAPYFSDDEDDTRSFGSTATRCSSSQQRGFGGGNGVNGIQLTFLPDSDGFIHLMKTVSSPPLRRGSIGEGESGAESSSVVTMATTLASYRKQGGVLASCSSIPLPLSSSMSRDEITDPSYVSGFVSTPGILSQHSSRHSNGCSGGVHRRHPIRVSFVPIDLDLPLEEQHGGKFDVILHKLTEDILCMSKMLRARGRSGDELHEGFRDEINCENHDTLQPDVKDPDHVESTASMTRRQARASLRIERLRVYKEKVHPSCVLVDSPNNILAVMSRADMAEVLTRFLAGVTTKCGIPVRTPWYHVVDENVVVEAGYGSTSTLRHLADEIDRSGIEYPLIAKPLSAAGTKCSHHMGIVLARDGLQRLKTPCLLQEFANHGEQLFKVYVLGDSVWVSSRESLPNLPIGEKHISNDADLVTPLGEARPWSLQNWSRKESYVEFERPAGSRCYVEFDSQRPYPKLADFGIKATDDEPSFRRRKKQRLDESSPESSRNTEERQQKSMSLIKNNNIADGNIDGDSNLARFVTTDEIEPVTNALRDAFGLELFGFDVIVKHDPSSLFDGGSDGKEILVVDVNYFPGYKEVPNFPSLLAQYLTQKAVESRVRNLDGS